MELTARAVAALGAALLLSAALPARAGEEEDKARAKTLFDQGVEAKNQKRCEAAIPLFRQSQRVYPARGTLFNLAFCEEDVGQIASAWRDYSAVIPLLDATDTRRAKAIERVTALTPRVPKLRIVLDAGAPPETRVTLDGEALPDKSVGADLPVDPGKHVVTASIGTEGEKRVEVTFAERSRRTVTIGPRPVGTAPATGAEATAVSELPTDTSSPRAPPDTPERPTSPMRIAGFVIGGLGAAGLVVTAVTGGLAIARKSDLDAKCPTGPSSCKQNVGSIASQGQTFSTAATASFVAGLAGAGLGVTLIAVGGNGAAPSRASFAPAVVPGGAGFSAAFQF